MDLSPQELRGAGHGKDPEVMTGLMIKTAVPTRVPALGVGLV